MAKSFKYTDGNYLDSTGIVHNQTLLSELLNLLPSERGSIRGNQMSKDTSLGQAYITINFSKTYENIPSVICGNGAATSSRAYWGNIPVYARSVTTKNFVLVAAFADITNDFIADYLVFNNDEKKEEQ